MPFETILIPTLRRRNTYLSVSEFRNLIGRSGRPGVNTEGRSLVLLSASPLSTDGVDEKRSIRYARTQYEKLIRLMQNEKSSTVSVSMKSPIAELLRALWENWKLISNSESLDEFYIWLEKTAPVDIPPEQFEQPFQKNAIETLDSIDGVILSAIVEIEQTVQKDISLEDLEQKLVDLWRRTFAYYSEKEEKLLGEYFVRRGKALLSIYPNVQQRRRLYCTSVQPRSGSLMLERTPNIVEHLKTGNNYALWDEKTKYEYLRRSVELISELPKFSLSATPQKSVAWDEILQWWLRISYATKTPNEDNVSKWFDYVSRNFTYRFNWGFGSAVSLIINDANKGALREFHLKDWGTTGLPWIVLWIKELITWGTLDPVVAYLLSQSMEVTRTDAEKAASIYYADNNDPENIDSLLDPRNIREWASQSLKVKRSVVVKAPPNGMSATLNRDFSNSTKTVWRVLPVIAVKEKIMWFDSAGFLLAESNVPQDWDKSYFANYDFLLNSSQKIISWVPYL